MNYYVMSDVVNNFNDKIVDDVLRMCWDYHQELAQYDPEYKNHQCVEDDVVNDYCELMKESDYNGEESQIDFVYILDLDNDRILAKCVGFLTIEKNVESSKLPEGIDYYISGAYIKPEYRNKGLMKKALISYCYENRGEFIYYVLNENENAKTFWSLIFEKVFCKQIAVVNQYNEFNEDIVTMYQVTV